MAEAPSKLDSFITDFGVLKLGADETLVIRVPEGVMDEVDTIIHMRAAVAEMVGTEKVIVVSDNVTFEVIKTEKLLDHPPCEHCGGSNRDEGGKPCEFCPPWMPRKFA